RRQLGPGGTLGRRVRAVGQGSNLRSATLARCLPRRCHRGTDPQLHGRARGRRRANRLDRGDLRAARVPAAWSGSRPARRQPPRRAGRRGDEGRTRRGHAEPEPGPGPLREHGLPSCLTGLRLRAGTFSPGEHGAGRPERGDGMSLESLGWNTSFGAAFEPHAAAGHQPARVVVEERGVVRVATGRGEVVATLAGRLRHEAGLDPGVALPAVGDWVAISGDPAGGPVVQAVLPRSSAIVRRAPSDDARPTQVLAANVDVAFLVTSLNRDFNLRRLERSLAVAWESGATPVVLLSKSDLVPDAPGMRLAAEAVAPGTDVIAVSAVTG